MAEFVTALAAQLPVVFEKADPKGKGDGEGKEERKWKGEAK